MPVPKGNPKVSREDNGALTKPLDCHNSNQGAKLPHASPATRVLPDLWVLLC